MTATRTTASRRPASGALRRSIPSGPAAPPLSRHAPGPRAPAPAPRRRAFPQEDLPRRLRPRQCPGRRFRAVCSPARRTARVPAPGCGRPAAATASRSGGGVGPCHDAPRQRAGRRRLRHGTRRNCPAPWPAPGPAARTGQQAAAAVPAAGLARGTGNRRDHQPSRGRAGNGTGEPLLTTASGTCGSPSPAEPYWSWPSLWASCWRHQHRSRRWPRPAQISKPPADALDNGTVPDVAGLDG